MLKQIKTGYNLRKHLSPYNGLKAVKKTKKTVNVIFEGTVEDIVNMEAIALVVKVVQFVGVVTVATLVVVQTVVSVVFVCGVVPVVIAVTRVFVVKVEKVIVMVTSVVLFVFKWICITNNISIYIYSNH